LPNADERDGISLHNVAGQLLIVAPKTSDDREFPDGTVWKLDTATNALVMLLQNYELHPVANINGKLLLAEGQTADGLNDALPLVLWATDGSTSGTKIVWEGTYTYPENSSSVIAGFHQAGNALYFDTKVGDRYAPVTELRPLGRHGGGHEAGQARRVRDHAL
jgi:hypothetical protein